MKRINRQLNAAEQAAVNQTLAEMRQVITADAQIKAFVVANQDLLTENPIDDNLSVLYDFLVAKQAPTDDVIPQLVINQKSIAINYQSNQVVSNLDRYQKIFGDFDSQNINVSLNDLQTTQERKVAVNQLVEKINQLTTNNGQFVKGIFFYGQFGVGKSFLLGTISNALAEAGINNIIVHWPSFIKQLQSQFNQAQNNSNQLLEQLKQTKVLMIDDLGADSLSVWSRDDILAPILEYRMAHKKTTFFSSNFDFKYLESDYLTTTKDTHEPIKAGRLMQRIQFLSDQVLVGGDNRRLN